MWLRSRHIYASKGDNASVKCVNDIYARKLASELSMGQVSVVLVLVDIGEQAIKIQDK